MKQIGTKYKVNLDAILGEGNYGTVYEGEVIPTHQKIAVKVIPKSLLSMNSYTFKAFLDEAKILSTLKSPNIVAFDQILQTHNNYYIFQQFCNGDNLKKAINTKGPFSQQDAINILKQICNGFICMLKEGVVHRNLKPSNILLHNGVVKICDFGYSKRLKQNKNQILMSKVINAPVYKSIQILKSLPYTNKCDVWSIGVIFYEMLHKRTPWTATSELQLIQKMQKQPLKISPELDPSIQSFLKQTLEIYEQKRIGWDDLYAHPIFHGYFKAYVEMNKSFQNKLKTLLNELRFVIISQNINLEQLFNNQGYDRNAQLSFDLFKSFIRILQVPVTLAECKYAFQAIDIDRSNTVSLEQLEKIFNKHQIPLKSSGDNFQFQHKESLEWQGSKHEESSYDIAVNKLRQAFLKIEELLILKNIQLYQYYDEFDEKKEGDLTVVEITKMLRSLNETFTEEEIEYSFSIIDASNNMNITLSEFEKFYCNCVGKNGGLQYGRGKNEK